MASWPLTPPLCTSCPTPITMVASEYMLGKQRSYYCPTCRSSTLLVPAPK